MLLIFSDKYKRYLQNSAEMAYLTVYNFLVVPAINSVEYFFILFLLSCVFNS